MAYKTIMSSENEYIKKIMKLRQRKYRMELGLFVIEGERSCRDAKASDFEIESYVMTEEFFNSHKNAFDMCDCIVTTDKIFDKISDTKTPQGVLAVSKIPDSAEFLGNRYIYCDNIQDPGNAGTIIRSADAFGFDGVIFSSGSVDVYSPKVVRSSMGSIFHINVIVDKSADFLLLAQQSGYRLTAGALHGKCVLAKDMICREKQIFIVGNEGNGVSSEILSFADEVVYINMSGKSESLNAGVAASILMYEVTRNE